MPLEFHTKADFRKVDRLWGFNLKRALQHIGNVYGSYFGLPSELAQRTERAIFETPVYVIGGGPYVRLPVGANTDEMCDYPSALSEFDVDSSGTPAASIFLSPFPMGDPKDSWKAFGEHEGQRLSREKQVRMFQVFYRSHTLALLYHECGHLFTKYLRGMRGQPEHDASAFPCSNLFDEAACMFYTDANYDWRIKPFRLNESAGEIWGNAVQEFGSDVAKRMFLEHDYSRLAREDYIGLANRWKDEIVRTKAKSPLAA